MSIKNGIKTQFTEFDSNETNIFIYFDNAHIIGQDLKNQPSNLKGLLIINENSKYTEKLIVE